MKSLHLWIKYRNWRNDEKYNLYIKKKYNGIKSNYIYTINN